MTTKFFFFFWLVYLQKYGSLEPICRNPGGGLPIAIFDLEGPDERAPFIGFMFLLSLITHRVWGARRIPITYFSNFSIVRGFNLVYCKLIFIHVTWSSFPVSIYIQVEMLNHCCYERITQNQNALQYLPVHKRNF